MPETILFLTQVLPYPLDAGPKLRAYYVLREIGPAARGDVRLLRPRRRIARNMWRIWRDSVLLYIPCRWKCLASRTSVAGMRALAQGGPVVIERDSISAMHRKLDEVLAYTTVAAVHADQTSMVQYALWVAVCLQASKPWLAPDVNNALYKVFARLAQAERNSVRRLLLDREVCTLHAYERGELRQVDHVVFVTAEDQAEFDLPATSVIPICVEPAARVARRADARTVTFVGALHWPPNAEGVRWFLTNVWPQVRGCTPTVQIYRDWQASSRRTCRGSCPAAERDGHRLRCRFDALSGRDSRFCRAIYAGGGMRVKIVDAWSWGVPIVATTIGARASLPTRHTD